MKLSDIQRKAALYSVASQFPKTRQTRGKDKRCRQDIRTVAQQEAIAHATTYLTSPLKHSIGRPPMGHVGFVQDLTTTIPLDVTYNTEKVRSSEIAYVLGPC